MKLYLEPCWPARIRTLCWSLLAMVLAVVLMYLDQGLAGFSFVLAVLSFLLLVYIDKFLVLNAQVGFGWAFFRFVFIPIGVMVFIYPNLDDEQFKLVAVGFDKYLSSTLVGGQKTAESLSRNGFEESALKVKVFFLFGYLSISLFAVDLALSAMSSFGRIGGAGDINERIANLKKVPLLGMVMVVFLLFFPFYFDAFIVGCTGRKGCGVEHGRVGGYLVVLYACIAMGYLFLLVTIWSSLLVRMLKIKYGDK